MSWLCTPDFLSNHQHFRHWRYQQCFSCERLERSAVWFGRWLRSACHRLIWVDGLDSKRPTHRVNRNQKTTPFVWGCRPSPRSAPASEQLDGDAPGDGGDPWPSSFTALERGKWWSKKRGLSFLPRTGCLVGRHHRGPQETLVQFLISSTDFLQNLIEILRSAFVSTWNF